MTTALCTCIALAIAASAGAPAAGPLLQAGTQNQPAQNPPAQTQPADDPLDQQPRVGDGVRAGQEVATPREGVEVVVLDGVEAVGVI